MCGIAGVAALGGARPPTTEQIQRMCDTLVHRGPDDQGIEVKDGVGMGMRRLSIIDVKGGRQPIHNGDGTVRTIFNGEIYNFRELRRVLEARGYRFRTRSDTEILVHGYDAYGNQLPQHLNGMFGFAIHDLRRRKLLLARDHVGIKPLYYSFTPNHLIWGSEVKALLASGLVERDLDLDALAEFLTWEYVPGARTLFRSIRKLPAGHLLEVDLDAPRHAPQAYWDVPERRPEVRLTAGEWEEAVAAELTKAVKRQLVSDVPLGAFLSGGVDSSLIVASMGPAKTFSIGFDDDSYDELRWARKVADHLGLDHKTETIQPNVAELFTHLMHFMDDPIGDFSIFPTYLVSRLARQDVKVVLSGDGGDELFGGYETYVAQRLARAYEKVPRWLREILIARWARSLRPRPEKKGFANMLKRFVEGADNAPALGHARWRLFMCTALRDAIFVPDVCRQLEDDSTSHIVDAYDRASARGPLEASNFVDFKTYLCDNILVKLDRMSMAASLEARVPFLDPELVALAFQVPEELKIRGRQTKWILKRIAAKRVPPECIYRPKEGFSVPIKSWLKTGLREPMADLLDPGRLRNQGLFEPDVVERLKREHLADVANHSHILWSLMVFQAWNDLWGQA